MISRAFLSGPVAPVLAACAGIAAFSAMDAAIKGAALAVGVYTALLLRNVLGTLLILPVWLAGERRLPPRSTLALHVLRSAVNTAMALLFFVAVVRLPLAEAIALSFIAPLIALFLSAIVLGERIRRRAVLASLLGLAGVAVIAAGRLGAGEGADSVVGLVAMLASAVLYAVNLVLQRKQALLAGPVEIALSQSGIIAVILALAAPWLFVVPSVQVVALATLGAGLATLALLLLAWGYARAEAQVLLPIEYTAFLWAMLCGWLFFDEPVGAATLAGAALIVLGCWVGSRNAAPAHVEQTCV